MSNDFLSKSRLKSLCTESIKDSGLQKNFTEKGRDFIGQITNEFLIELAGIASEKLEEDKKRKKMNEDDIFDALVDLGLESLKNDVQIIFNEYISAHNNDKEKKRKKDTIVITEEDIEEQNKQFEEAKLKMTKKAPILEEEQEAEAENIILENPKSEVLE
eukprot:TRINITY_DN7762_c0_g1_i1.p1 TRINITY_DN7762_c0_g1~~TRINITY_DN7762_c0_g1_i1.p1  ORF type:complete len:171 (+),score=72.76 TRINITY_DN7762_c0_g1_i1:34-513(+)